MQVKNQFNSLKDLNVSHDLEEGVPLVVDLDGTFFIHDTFEYNLVSLFLRRPIVFIRIVLLVIFARKAQAKNLALENSPAIALEYWPTNNLLLSQLTEAKNLGFKIYLCSGASQIFVDKVATHYGFFHEAFGSSLDENLTGSKKAAFLAKLFGDQGFYYVGNSKDDIPVFNVAKNSWLTDAYSDNFGISKSRDYFSALIRQLRIKHWTKNLLIFLPLVGAQEFLNLSKISSALIFFLLFGVLTSSTYILNDIYDLQSDLKHDEKRYRPVASGKLNPRIFLLLSICLIFLAIFGISFQFGILGLALSCTYLILTLFYSLKGKSILGVDVIILAILYTLRIFAGITITEVPMSVWLIGFSFVLFFSLSTAKRYVEVSKMISSSNAPGRAYGARDAEALAQIGSAAALSSVVIYLLYCTSEEVAGKFEMPYLLLLGIPVLVYWVSHLWIAARRGAIDSDPINWALRDRGSKYAAGLFVAIFVISGFITRSF